jgi:hypothetical protein
VLAVTMLAVPLIMVQCTASCDAGAGGFAAPSCHHQPFPEARIGPVPTACGHDHRARVTTLTPETTIRARAQAATVEAAAGPEPVLITAHCFVTAFASPPDEPLARELAASLRI